MSTRFDCHARRPEKSLFFRIQCPKLPFGLRPTGLPAGYVPQSAVPRQSAFREVDVEPVFVDADPLASAINHILEKQHLLVKLAENPIVFRVL